MIRRAQTDVAHIAVPDDREYLLLVQDILENPTVGLMKNYMQHGDTTCLAHCVNVSYLSYLYCRRHGLNARSAARAGLLHDLFLYDWHLRPRQKGERLHGFEHPRKALANAEAAFTLSEMEKNIILRHMFPLTVTPPRYAEAYVVVCYDKYCSLKETFRQPVMEFDDGQDASIDAGLALHGMPQHVMQKKHV